MLRNTSTGYNSSELGSYNCPNCCHNLVRTGERKLRCTDCGRIVTEIVGVRR